MVVGTVVVSETSLVWCLVFVELRFYSVVEKACKEFVKWRYDRDWAVVVRQLWVATFEDDADCGLSPTGGWLCIWLEYVVVELQ